MKLIFVEWPESGDVFEVWITKIEGPDVVTQASLDFSKEAADAKAAVLNEGIPGVARVIGLFVLD